MNGERSVKTTWRGLLVTGVITPGGWEGDPSIPRGTHPLEDTLDDLDVLSPSGESLFEYLTPEALDEIIDIIFQEETLDRWSGV